MEYTFQYVHICTINCNIYLYIGKSLFICIINESRSQNAPTPNPAGPPWNSSLEESGNQDARSRGFWVFILWLEKPRDPSPWKHDNDHDGHDDHDDDDDDEEDDNDDDDDDKLNLVI
jgi:hypothetical protein